MDDCIFCKIASGEIPSEKIYEDDKVFVLLDINPYVLGHCLVIPKEHEQYVWNVSDYDHYMKIVQKTAKVLERAFDTELVQGGIAAVEIDHAHFHLFPRDKIDAVENGFPNKPMNPKPSEEEMKDIFEKIKMALE